MQSIALSVALLAAVTNATGAIPASKVCVTNIGGYDLKWWFDDLLTGKLSTESGTYPIDQTRCMTVDIDGMADGDIVEVYVHAIAGVTK